MYECLDGVLASCSGEHDSDLRWHPVLDGGYQTGRAKEIEMITLGG
jgi:hypothetical protein